MAITYKEWLNQNPTATNDWKLDSATISSIEEWFQYRHVCSNLQFGNIFKRAINLYRPQYEQLLRIESVEFDPMMSQYAERWINNTGENTTDGTNTGENTTTGNANISTNNTTTETPGVVETRTQSTEYGRTETTENTATETPNLTTETTSDSTTDGESTSTGTTTSSAETTATQNSTNSGNSSSTSRTLHGVLPDSSTYPQAAAAAAEPAPVTPVPTALPSQLNWTYADNQDEASEIATEGSTTETKGTTNQTAESSVENGTTSSASTNANSSVTQRGTNTRDENGSVKLSGTDTNTEKLTRTGDNTTQQSGTNTSESNTTVTNSGTTKSTGKFDNTTREISAGRGEAPQDLLIRARDYIMQTNAFKWFRDRLEPCFQSVYEMEEYL